MKVSLNWLKEYLDLSLPPEKIADALTLAGLEAEGMEEREGDVILEVGLTPNLGHCMSLLGMARELAAILQIELKPKPVKFTEGKELAADLLSVEIADPSQCHRYGARIVKGIQVGNSPEWLKQKVESAGLRSVNNVVDLGNYVMLATGQPLHLFDFDQLEEEICVRAAKNDGNIVTLDGEERVIEDGLLIISSGKKPVAFAGVMGEKTTAVSEATHSVLIEAAHFTPEAVRKCSKTLNLRTESSSRFERGIDPLGVTAALDLAAKLLQEVAGGEIAQGTIEVIAKEYKPQIVEMQPKRCNELLGVQLSLSEISSLFQRLEIEVISESTEGIKVAVPSYRNDLRKEIDLIEEIGRMYGFNNIPRPIPRHASSPITHSPLYLLEEEARSKLVAQGLQECLTCDLISPKLANLTAAKELIHVLHPASIDQSVLRPSLLPGLLEVVKFNIDRQNMTLAAFEVGHVHLKESEETIAQPTAAIMLTGRALPYHHEHKPKDVDFFDLKGRVEDFFEAMGIAGFHVETSHLQSFHPGRQARIKMGEISPGVFGEVHPKHLREMGIEQRVYFAEINLLDLLPLRSEAIRVQNPATYPGSERDWTLSLHEKVEVGPILEMCNQLDSSILEGVFLLDLYKSEKIGKDRKNATFRFRYRDPNKTVKFEEVEEEHKRITQLIAENIKNSVG